MNSMKGICELVLVFVAACLSPTAAQLFSHIPCNRVMRWKECEDLRVFLQPSGFTGPSEYGTERVISCEHGDRRELDFRGVYRVTPDGVVTLLCDTMPHPNGIAASDSRHQGPCSAREHGELRGASVTRQRPVPSTRRAPPAPSRAAFAASSTERAR